MTDVCAGLTGQGGGYGFSVEEAQAEADDLRAARLQSLVVALDKAKLFLRHQPREMRVRPVPSVPLLHAADWSSAVLGARTVSA